MMLQKGVWPFLRSWFQTCKQKFGKLLSAQTWYDIVSSHYLLKWLPISVLIGAIAGLGAIAFYIAIHFATSTFLDQIVGYQPPEPTGEGGRGIMPFWSAVRPLLLPLITTAGGLLSGIIVYAVAPEAEGHGTDTAIQTIHEGKKIRVRVPLIKLLASAITIGTGGSAGREGPAAQISAGFGSILATVFHLNTHDRRIAMAAGLGAGIGAIFRTPLGGAILAAELLYINDLEVEALFPAITASVVSYSIFGFWSHWQPIFPPMTSPAFTSPFQLLYYIPLGVICGLVGLLYSRSFYGTMHFFHRISIPKWCKPALGGLLVGLLGLALPEILGGGDGWLQFSMGQGLLSLPLWLILLLPFAKILATNLTVGTGGSGGIFGPGLVIGGLLGAAVWRLCYHVLPGIPDVPGPFVIVGMIALFGGIAHAPIAVMVMIAEMTGNLSILVPAMIAISISSLLIGNETIYKSQFLSRINAPAHRPDLSFLGLPKIPVRELLSEVPHVIITQSLAEAEQILLEQHKEAGLVVDKQNRFKGAITLSDIKNLTSEKRKYGTIKQTLKREMVTIDAAATLEEAWYLFKRHDSEWAHVVTRENASAPITTAGLISLSSIQEKCQTLREENLAASR